MNPATPEEASQQPRAKAVDVAASARVSVATVSLVANGKAAGRVSESTRRRVMRAIEELGYVVNPAARSLATGRRRCVALVARDMTNPFISTIAAGVAEALGTQTQLLLAVSGSGTQSPDIEQVLNAGVDGVLLDFPMAPGAEQLEAQCPVVLMDDPKTPKGTTSVYFDLRRGASDLASHLTGLGHQVIVYLDTPRPLATFQDRRRYLSEEVRRLDKNTRIIRTSSDIEIGSARGRVIASWPGWDQAGVTAIVAASDVQAYGVLAALSDLGVSVPGRVSVASFDDLPFAAITSPPLTAISLSAFDLGFEAATLLQDVIERSSRAQRSVVLPTRLVVRGSTGPAAT
jgi:LacI family transcriptional regulator